MVADDLDALERGALAGARQLTLRGGLRAVPDAVRGLAGTLEVLDLSGNALEALPDWLPELSRLRVVFASRNRFERLPPVLGACPALEQVGFRDCGVIEVPEAALPERLRWLTLTGNRIERLPAALGTRPALRKLMLSGNRLERLPDSFADARALELLRLSNNRLGALPPFLSTLPSLAWLSWSGNPFENAADATVPVRRVPAGALSVGAALGRGSSGEVFRAEWRSGNEVRPVAVKRFLSEAVSSDGAPEQERRAALRAGDHPCLVGALGVVAGGELDGALVSPLVPDGWEVLAGPPSLESCSRDVYAPERRFAPAAAARIAADAARGMARLHARGLLHGDLYGHNLLFDPRDGAARLGDLGAASVLPEDAARWTALDVRAWGILLGELLERGGGSTGLDALRDACCGPVPAHRPDAATVVRELERPGAGY